jgi:hypothetical protein
MRLWSGTRASGGFVPSFLLSNSRGGPGRHLAFLPSSIMIGGGGAQQQVRESRGLESCRVHALGNQPANRTRPWGKVVWAGTCVGWGGGYSLT